MARRVVVLAILLAALIAATIAELALGAIKVPPGEVIDILLGNGHGGPNQQIVEALRLPRTIEALVVGGALGVAGAILQGALANPLASPDVIGVTGGAGFGAILIIVLFPEKIALLPIGALVFGLLAAALVFIFAWTGRNRGAVAKVVLAGIAMLSLFTAGTTGLLAAYPDKAPSAIFFLAGGLSSSGWENLHTTWPYFAAGGLIVLFLIRPLDRLALGDDVAASIRPPSAAARGRPARRAPP